VQIEMLAASQFGGAATIRRRVRLGGQHFSDLHAGLTGPTTARHVATLAPVAARAASVIAATRRRHRGLSGLGAGTAVANFDPTVQTCFPLNIVSGTAGFTQADQQWWAQCVQAGQLLSPPSGPQYATGSGCGAPVKSSTAAVTATTTVVGAALLKFGGATGPAAPFVLAAGAALEVLGDIFGIFGAGHAAAVRKEQATLCDYVPAANSALQAVTAGLNGGQLTSASASSALDNLVSAFKSAVSGILKMSGSSQCNEACQYIRALCGIVAQMKLDIAAAPPPADTNPAGAISVAGGLPSWWMWAAGFAALYFLV
jgi:hypothetical protein